MKKSSIDEILSAISIQLKSIENDINLEKINRVTIKNTMENLRSVLDYIAIDINNKLSSPKSKAYFPYSKERELFNNSVQKNLPNLNIELPNIYNLIKEIQPFESGDDWLSVICNLVNFAKHNDLSSIEKKEIFDGITAGGIDINKCKNISLENVGTTSVYIKKIKIVDGEIIELIIDNFSKVELLSYISFSFSNNEYEILPFLKLSNKNISKFANDIYEIL